MRRKHRYVNILLATFLSLGLLVVVSGTAIAHAKVISATPGIGSTIATPPTTVTVQTAENVNPDPKLSNLFVYGPSGDLISQGDAKVSLNNPKEMSVAIKPEKSGIYVVRWITVSALDGDPDQGAFTFTVKAAAATATPPAQAVVSGFPILPVVSTAIVALLVGLGIGFAIGRTRSVPAANRGFSASSQQTQEETIPKQSS